jgi:ankyrin repeat protein
MNEMESAIRSGDVIRVMEVIRSGYPLNLEIPFEGIGEIVTPTGSIEAFTAMGCAVSWSTPEVVELLLANGAYFSHNHLKASDDVYGICSQVMNQALWNSAEMVRLLMKKGIPLRTLSFDEGMDTISLLDQAAIRGQSDVIRLLLELGADIEWVDMLGCTALHNSTLFNNSRAVTTLVSCGADLRAQTHAGLTPKEVASASGFSDLADLLRDLEEQQDFLKAKDTSQKKSLAFSMGHHPRLGHRTWVSLLEPEIVRMITDEVQARFR